MNSATVAEEQKSQKTYEADKSKLVKTKAANFHGKVREALIDAGLFPTKQVDQKMKEIDPEADVPQALRDSFYRLVKEAAKQRVASDADYAKGRFPNID